MEEKNTQIDKVAIALFAFLQQVGIKASVQATPGKTLSYTFAANDMTNLGEGFGLSFIITSDDTIGLDDEASIEKYCFQQVLNVGMQLLSEKATRLLQHSNEIKQSRIIVPGR